MVDPRVTKLARLLVGYSLDVQPDDLVYISGDLPGLPLVREAYREVLRAGGHPYVRMVDETMREMFLKEASESQLSFVHEPVRYISEHYDAALHLLAPENSRYLSAIDPERQAVESRARRSIAETTMARTAEGTFRWSLSQYPTSGSAQDADMSLSDYADFVYSAYRVDEPDPVALWQEISRRHDRLVDYLADKQQVEVRGEHIDLSLSIAGRRFINDDGHFNMPGGEIFTGPVESSVNGWVRFSYPAIYRGREVEGIELTFEEGRVTRATATKNEAFLLSVLDTDEGARYLGEWAIGTNDGIDRFTRNIGFDEKIGGTLHMAVGAGYPESGSQNRSAVHWDMICDLRDGAEIVVDGELFCKGGRFLIE